MLGVLKRRWKPKRASSGRRSGQGKTEPVLQGDAADKPARTAASPRQIHPVCEDKAQLLAYENKPTPPALLATSPAQHPVLPPAPPPLPTYPLTPNICVEAGRIEFIKTPTDVVPEKKFPPVNSTPAPQQKPTQTVTRAQQTVDEEEKSDVAKESLEARVLELERALEAEQKNGQRERLALTRLQRQLARREVLQRDVDRERRLRLDTEVRLRDTTSEAERCRARLASLQREFGRMEDTVRSMLQYKGRAEQLKQEKTSLTVAYETRIHQFQNTITKLGQENESLRKQLCALEAAGAGEVQNSLVERLRALETENCNLTRDAEVQRRQYERCLDDVANQVVRALLSQKGLREEIGALHRRIKELEAQNRALASVLVTQLNQGSPSAVAEALSKLPSAQPVLGAGDEPLPGHAASTNLALSGAAETPMTSATSVSTPSSSDLITPEDRRHHQILITPTSSDLATPDDELAKSRLRKQVTPTSSDLATPEEEVSKVTKLRKHHHAWEEGLTAALWLPLQRPRSLNLQLHGTTTGQQVAALAAVTASKCCQHRRNRPLLAHMPGNKLPPVVSNNNNAVVVEDEGSESPESGNRDEGYSTMSSDVQGEAVRSGEQPATVPSSATCGLEDLKEVTDETSDVVAVTTPPAALVASTTSTPNRLLVVEDACDPDVLYIPLGLALGLSTGNPRHSFPPSRDLLPYQHIMRSFSDSHLCLKITAAAPSPSPVQQHSSFSLSSTASSSPSVLVLDVLSEAAQKQAHPLRRTKATSSLLSEHHEFLEEDDAHSNSGSWCSGVVEGCWWDADYVQHWLRLDDTRSALQQQHRDLLELEYDQAELEDWSMSLSCEDIDSSAATSSADSSSWRRPVQASDSLTPGMSLPSIQENNALELEEDSSECLWNNASYLIDHRNGENELISLLMEDAERNESDQKSGWPYNNGGNYSLASPGGSWSSTGTNSEDCCHSYDCSYNGCGPGGYHETSSKRSSAAMSGCSDDAGSTESPAVGTDFTRDFYRLVKFESTKSLASTSSRSLAGNACVSDNGGSLTRRQGSDLSHDREQALQSVLNFIAEQQQYCASREEQDSLRSDRCRKSDEDTTVETDTKETDNNTRSDPLPKSEAQTTDTCSTLQDKKTAREEVTCNGIDFEEQIHTIIELDTMQQVYSPALEENEIQNSSNRKGKCSEVELNEQNSSTTKKLQNNNNKVLQDIKDDQVIDLKPITRLAGDIGEEICLTTQVSAIQGFEDQKAIVEVPSCQNEEAKSREEDLLAVKETNSASEDADEHMRAVYRPGLLKGLAHSPQCGGGGVGCCRSGEVLVTVIEEEDEHATSSSLETSSCREMTESMTSTVSTPDTVVSPATRRHQQASDLSVSSSSLAGCVSSSSSVIVTDSRAVSFHERATSKDVIDELNRMIRKGDEGPVCTAGGSSGNICAGGEGEVPMGATKLDQACCCPTGWVHVERDIDFTDPKARANLLDVMLASSGSSGGSSNSSSSSDSGDEPADYQHLHRLHRFRRQKKASATREQLGVLRYPASTPRPSIIGRDDFFVRYGDKEREAVASFDFLEDISTTSVSGASSCDTLGSSQKQQQQVQSLPPPRLPPQPPAPPAQHKKPPAQSEPEMTTPSSEDSDDRTGGQLSFSDSCAASFSGSSASLENQEV